jgi:hypothetical protein
MIKLNSALIAAAILLSASGVASAQAPQATTSTTVEPNAPVISGTSQSAHNPAVNPAAAGLSQGYMAAPDAGRAGAHRGQANATSRGDMTAAQARQSLRYYGYSGITNLHVNQGGHWQAQANMNGRRVKVVLDERGAATQMK